MSTRNDHVLPDRSRRALLMFALATTVGMASPVLAQNNPFGQAPGRPFQEEAPEKHSGPNFRTTPQRHTQLLEAWAKEQISPVEREMYYTISHADDDAEFDALAHYSLLILTVVTQTAQELPVRRVYTRLPDREIPVLKLASWRRDVDQTLVTYKMYGPYREDGLYLFPLGAYLRTAQIQMDLATNRSGLPVLELPAEWPDWLRTVQSPEPIPGALPNLRTLQDFIKRKTSGFPVPTSVPAAEASHIEYSKKPRSLW